MLQWKTHTVQHLSHHILLKSPLQCSFTENTKDDNHDQLQLQITMTEETPAVPETLQ